MEKDLDTKNYDVDTNDIHSDEEIKSTLFDTNRAYENAHFRDQDFQIQESNIWNNVDEAYEAVKGNGTFIPAYALILGIGASMASLSVVIPLLVKVPDLQCSSDAGQTWNSWDHDDAWSSSSSLIYRKNNKSIETIDNWITKFDMIWADGILISLFGALYFIGFVIGAVTIVRLGDIYGRKPISVWTNILSIFIYIGLYFANSKELVYVLLVPTGALYIARFILLYIYMLELMPENLIIFYHIISSILGTLLECGFLVYFIFVDDGLKIFFVIIAASLVHMIWHYYWPESPKFLYSQRRFDELHESLSYIAEVNKAEPWNKKFTIECTTEYSESGSDLTSTEISMIDAIKDSIYRSNLIIMAFNWCVCSLSFYVINFYISDFPGSTFVNWFILIISDVISTIVTLPAMKLIGLNHGFSCSYAIVIVLSIISWFVKHITILAYFWVFFIRFGVNLAFNLWYFGSLQIFRVKLRSRSFAVCNLFARILTIGSPLIVELVPFPMLLIAVWSLITWVISQFIVEDNRFDDDNDAKDK